MSTKNTDVVVHEATQIWSSVEYGNGPHKAGRFFVQLCDYDAVVAELSELRAYKEAAENQEPVAWGAFYYGGKYRGQLYSHAFSEEQIDDYIANIHRSNDSITLRKGRLYANPVPAECVDAQESMAWLANALEQYAKGEVITVPSGAETEEEFFTWLKNQSDVKGSKLEAPSHSQQSEG